MSSTTPIGGGGALPELRLIDLLDVFVPGRIAGPVRITKNEPLVGELIRDATGRYFIAPEEDYRGGGMQSIPALGLSAKAKTGLVNKVVHLTGVFEDGKGVTVEAIAQRGQPLADPEVGGKDAMSSGRPKNPYTGQV